MNEKYLIFDAYGTLFDIASPVEKLTDQLPANIDVVNLTNLWRQKQLEYTWTLTLMGNFIDFFKITELSLEYTLEKLNLKNSHIFERLLDSYKNIELYSDVYEALKNFKSKNIRSMIFSNATYKMLDDAIDVNGLNNLIDGLCSVEEIKLYKPHSDVYQFALKKFNVKKDYVFFVSSNPWDIAGATSAGIKSIWLNRNRNVFDKYPYKPYEIAQSLYRILEII